MEADLGTKYKNHILSASILNSASIVGASERMCGGMLSVSTRRLLM